VNVAASTMHDGQGSPAAKRGTPQTGIPPCPPLLADLVQETTQPHPDIGWAVRLIERDGDLAAALLAAVNSPLGGVRHRIASVRSAVTFGGVRYCANFVASVMLRRALGAPRSPQLDAFWEQAAERALVIAYLARELAVADFDEARTFGLFRDCGIALMMRDHPDYAQWRAAAKAQRPHDIAEQERARYGVDHALMGALLAKHWCLPKDLWLPVSLHHLRTGEVQASGASGDPVARLIAAGVLADCIVGAHSSSAPRAFLEQEEHFALRVLGVRPQDIAALRSDIELLLAAP
jgi:HD-like signal output (HDOD) protein